MVKSNISLKLLGLTITNNSATTQVLGICKHRNTWQKITVEVGNTYNPPAINKHVEDLAHLLST
jgi:protoheme ferro-lyase